ncbi:hypothetical protein MCG98_16610 [Ruminococcus sp. OA3]|uniref:hypothetical protein n=1 Tax=Ruminococcus sp. OA3 TaxID=2914164 RepID=UPI001F0705B9|nr:hypothetical protein [Ruminococcus sp. OA3]MCH1984190.1 hypothetical protein [Ruminococcus sp. OA3]
MDTKKQITVLLTEDPLENIKIIAPLLDEASQHDTFIYMLGIYNGMKKEDNSEKEGKEV